MYPLRHVAAVALPVVGLLASTSPACAEWLSGQQAIMGTVVRVELWSDDQPTGKAAIAAVMEEMRRIDRTMSTYKEDSDVSLINRNAGQSPVIISSELLELIARSLQMSELTDGAFDITYASAGHLYDFRRKIKPSEEALAKALPAINYHHILLDRKRSTIKFSQAGVVIDLGGIAKGHAVDRCIALLQARGIKQAIVSAGGDSRIIGDHHGRPWMVGIRDPRQESKVVAALPLSNAAVSTSGDYERYFEANGVRYHHIINPTNGRPVNGVRSVTVVGSDSTTMDALSTSVFVMGVKKGMALVERLTDVEAVIVDDEGKMYYSRGLERR